jgi:hypothetical protein
MFFKRRPVHTGVRLTGQLAAEHRRDKMYRKIILIRPYINTVYCISIVYCIVSGYRYLIQCPHYKWKTNVSLRKLMAVFRYIYIFLPSITTTNYFLVYTTLSRIVFDNFLFFGPPVSGFLLLLFHFSSWLSHRYFSLVQTHSIYSLSRFPCCVSVTLKLFAIRSSLILCYFACKNNVCYQPITYRKASV